MSKNINIDSTARDPSYRYKMPPLNIKKEGRGNGARTVVVNICEVSKALKVDATWPTKFFGLELGTQARYDKIKTQTVLAGFHEARDLARLLDKFIAGFVLCPVCKLPEILLSVHKGKIKIDCAACGANRDLESNHKFVAFVVKNPPRGRKQATVRVEPPSRPTVSSAFTLETLEEEVEWATDTSEAAVVARQREAMASIDPLIAIETILEDVKSPTEIVNALANITRPISALFSVLATDRDPHELVSVIQSYREVFLRLTRAHQAQIDLLNAIEATCLAREDVAKRIIYILSSLYELDIIDDEAVFEWFDKEKISRGGVIKFVEWLRAEDEDDN